MISKSSSIICVSEILLIGFLEAEPEPVFWLRLFMAKPREKKFFEKDKKVLTNNTLIVIITVIKTLIKIIINIQA